MKKWIALVLALALALSLCACSSDEEVKGEVTETPFSMGVSEGTTYTNEYFGFGCTLSDDWYLYSEEEILEMNSISADAMGEELAEQIEKCDILYDMAAQYGETGESTINVNVENPGVAALALSTKDYLSSQQDMLKEGMENMGFETVNVTISTVKFAGSERDCAYVDCVIGDMTFKECIVTVKEGTRFANISIGTVNDDLDTILGYFYEV